MKYNHGLFHQVQMVCLDFSLISTNTVFTLYMLEKETVRQLISSAIKGLEDSGRIQPTAYFDDTTKAVQASIDSFGSLASNK